MSNYVEKAADMNRWLKETVSRLVERPRQVEVYHDIKYDEDDPPFVTYSVKVSDTDIGLVIGAGGKTVKLMRDLLQLIAWKPPKIRTRIEVEDPHPERRTIYEKRKRSPEFGVRRGVGAQNSR